MTLLRKKNYLLIALITCSISVTACDAVTSQTPITNDNIENISITKIIIRKLHANAREVCTKKMNFINTTLCLSKIALLNKAISTYNALNPNDPYIPSSYTIETINS
ncbi:hypothetical protein [Candidatus Liberibacter americanus]|uniref:Lipoprotein n=1 Tax=Candidatus Liberibacter americanus str. Sao Paulo TaxID=1261131 RepID=U6B5W0_9HYPH|nr:hypothetical protein [Candidatus Liberibacter americanus]AHA28298.1 hypothetical protein lam_968 [Candidatus Liberibacter americanus str. Sao Paulo]EMS36590.1 hypothetical protein G653_00045 [Candidatus Liberibacter americanus PW_SP]